MSKHSKNNSAGSVFTAHERKLLKYGTVTERLGSDSIKDCDMCALCLHPVKDPLCCKKGHLFCKECIYEYLLEKKKEIQRQLEIYEDQQKKIREDEERKAYEAKQQEIANFDKTVVGLGVIPGTGKPLAIMSAPSSNAVVLYNNQNDKNKTQPTTETAKVKPKINAFWVPGNTPEAPAAPMKAPKTDTLCPEGNHTIRLKQLTKLNFTPNKTSGGKPGDRMFECAVCSKTFTNSVKTVAVVKCGHVFCLQCMNAIKKDNACAVCSVKFIDKDLIQLNLGGTGYAGSSGEKLKASVVTPAAWL